jgi:alpha-beta hydrolase superfamily lysophospholipase
MTPSPVPLTFDTPHGWCSGWYHAPAAPWRDLAVVLCQPVGYEAICSYPTQVQLARSLAQAGFPVLRFDYHGTGDASGNDDDPARVQAWSASVEAAIAQARTLSGANHLCLFGLRLGATLAIDAASRVGGVDELVLWAPCPGGKAFVRELRAGGTEDAEGIRAQGFRFAPATVQDLLALDAMKFVQAPAPRVLLVPRDDIPAEGPLPKALRARGAQVDVQPLAGFAAMVGEPRAGVLDAPTLEALVSWLAASPCAVVREEAPPPLVADALPRILGGVHESPLRMRPHGGLYGVLSEPANAGDRARTAVVLLNVGGNHHVGPQRIYVSAARTLAAAGYRVLRMDIAGVGDSEPVAGQAWGRLYEKDSAQDVAVAIDALAARGCREFVLMGICSGSYVAFQSALAEPRVHGIVLMNSRLLEWTPGKPGDGWQDSMQQYAKSTAYYRRVLFEPEVWLRVARGQVNVRLIATRFLALATARIRRLFSIGSGREETLLHKMQRLCARGCDVLMLVSDADDGRDYVEFHFGASGRRLRAHRNFRMAYIPDADHTFTRPGNEKLVFDELLRHLAGRTPPGDHGTPARSPAPQATVTPLAPDGLALRQTL